LYKLAIKYGKFDKRICLLSKGDGVSMVDWVTIGKFAEETGLSKSTVARRKGWPEGLVWMKLGGRVLISKSGWDTWLDSMATTVRKRKHQPKAESVGNMPSLSLKPLNVNQLLESLEK
jgi:hypothetical protein